MTKKYITVKELAEIIPVGIGAIYRMVRQKTIPSYKIGGKRVFDRNEIEEWIKKCKEGE